MDDLFGPHASDPHGRSWFEFVNVGGQVPDAPAEKGVHLRSRDPQEAAGLSYSPKLTHFNFLEHPDSANSPPSTPPTSYLSGTTVCASPGNHDGYSDQQTKLQHSDHHLHAPSFPHRTVSKPPEGGPAWIGRPSNSRKRPRAADSDEGEDLESGLGGRDDKRPRPNDAWPKPKPSCPFYLENPVKHHQCSNYQFRGWSELRTHLFRKHRQLGKNPRDKHWHKAKFSGDAFEESSDITDEQADALGKITHYRGSKFEDVWQRVWYILFPYSPRAPSPFSSQRRPEDDLGSLTEADSRLLASGEFQRWIHSLYGMSNVGEDQRADVCRELIQTFHTRWLGQSSQAKVSGLRNDLDEGAGLEEASILVGIGMCDSDMPSSSLRPAGLQDIRLFQEPQREDDTDQDATSKLHAAIQSPLFVHPQDLEFLEDEMFNHFAEIQSNPYESPQAFEVRKGDGEFGDSPSTSSTGPSPDADTEPPLFTSIRRVLSEDSSYEAEDVISAIKKRSEGRISAFGSESAVIDSPTSGAPEDQESTGTSQGSNKRSTSTSGQSSSSTNKKQKTNTPSDADGDGSGNDGDGGGSDGGGSGGGGGTPPSNTPDESFDGWICPYCLKYVEITCIKDFQVCGRPGFRNRDDLRTHLTRLHSPEAKARPKNLEKGLGKYYMSAQQWEDVKGVMDNIKRPQKKKDPQRWLEVQKTWYSKVWAILFPSSQYVPDSPFHLSNEALKERCHQVVEAMMDLECGGAQARDSSSSEDTPLFTPLQVRKMLEKSLQIGLDSIPKVAQHFGDRLTQQLRDHQTQTEPWTDAATTTTEGQAAGPTPERSSGATPTTEVAAEAETEESATPENALQMISKIATTPSPVPIALDTGQMLQKTSDVLLESDGNMTLVSIGFRQRYPLQATDQALVAQVRVSAPSTFIVNIEELRNYEVNGVMF